MRRLPTYKLASLHASPCHCLGTRSDNKEMAPAHGGSDPYPVGLLCTRGQLSHNV